MAQRFLQIAVVYLFAGAALGIAMGVGENFALASTHSHLLLLGWVSLALAGIVYRLYPVAGRTLLGKLHFWLHNAGLPVFLVSQGLLLTGHAGLVPVVASSTMVVLVGLALLAINVLRHVKAA